MKNCFYAVLMFLVFAVPAFAGVSISSPSSGDHVSSPFNLSATATSCASHAVSSMGYSIGSGSTTILHGVTSFDKSVSASSGTHTVHVKAWNTVGGVCVSDVGIDVTSVTDDAVANTSVVPSSAISVSNIESMSNWKASHDSGASGTSSGKTSTVGSPSHSGSSRKFVSTYKNRGAVRYSVGFGDNRSSTNFFYDAWVYVTSSVSHVANIEMDVNQTMPNGQTVIFGVQCSAYSGTWEYTENLGTASNPKGHWASSSAACNPHKWSQNRWHHIQMEYSRTSGGHITYKYVWFDGTRHTINKYVYGARAMGWGSSISSNFQVDGQGSSGTSTVYLDSLKIYRW